MRPSPFALGLRGCNRPHACALALVALTFLLISIVGFTPRYFGPLAAGGYAPPSVWMHPHAAASMAFLLAFIIQPILIARGSIGLHRRAGIAALIIAAINGVTGFMLQVDLLPISPAPETGQLGAFTTRFILGIGIFVPAVVLGYIYRKRPQVHARLMYLAAMAVMTSPFNRILIYYLDVPIAVAGPIASAIGVALAAMMPIYDRVALGRVTRVSWLALAAMIASQLVFAYLFTSDWWVASLTN